MKKVKALLFALLTCLGVGSAGAESYVLDFDTPISTSSHDFAVASNWDHVVGSGNYDGYGPYYMTYSYYATSGVGGSGCLSAGRQYAGDYGGGTECTDLLITPEVKGTVTLAVKKTSSNNSFIEFYAMSGTAGAWEQGDKIAYTTEGGAELSQTGFVVVSINVADFTHIGIRASYMYLDNFTATDANLVAERRITIASAEPSATTGTIYWEQQLNGMVLVKYDVRVVNSGEANLTQGEEGYSVSVVNRRTGEALATVPVPEDLAVGDTSAVFAVQAEVPTTTWPNSYTYISMDLRENLKYSVVQRAQSHYKAYEPKFVFRSAGTTATSSITAAENWGTISESTTKSFEIANTGTAPLTVKSITLPEGFTSDNAPVVPEGGLQIEKGATLPLNITNDATVMGTFTGTLTIVYVDKSGVDQTYTLNFSATVIGANTWAADFNNTKSAPVYPAGSVAESGINSDYNYNSGKYDIWLTGRNTNSYATGNNKFITPKLHANAGDKLAFDVRGAYSSNNVYFAKVYVSADRQTWGDPVASYTYAEAEGAEAVGSSWVTKTITFDAEGDYYVAFALYGTFGIDNLVGLEKVDVAHDLYIKSVSWPDASVKSGTSLQKPSVDIIPLTDEAAGNYTVKYVYGENEVEIASKALTASANSTTTFTASFTPVVESTTVFENTKVVFEFADNTKFETEPFTLTVTNEPIFHFLSTLPSSKWYEPTDYTTPVDFGKTNGAPSKSFYVYNWGSAPLTVKSITAPEGFTVTPAGQFTVAAFDESNLSAAAQAVELVFSATEAGAYSGNLVVTYTNGAGEDATFELAVSGTKLDPTKWYANFDDGGWPAGSVYQANVSSSNGGTYSDPNYYITSSSATDNIFVTPKLAAAAGEKLMFDARIYSSSWSEGKVVVYAAATREEVLNAEEGTTRVELFSVSGEDAENPMTTDYQTFEVTVKEAGEYYFGFEISGRPYVDEIYGLTPVAVAHDLYIVSSNIPAEAMQNVATTASVNVLNLGLAEEAADAYTMTVFVDGEAVATGTTADLPVSQKLNDAGKKLSASFRYPKVGTFPVYVELTAGDYSLASEPVEVTFVAEQAVAEPIEVGAKTGSSKDNAIIDFYNLDGGAKTSDIVYTAEQLNAFGIVAGAKITTLSFKGTVSADKTIANSLTAWVGMKTGDITWNSPEKESMTEVKVFEGSMTFANGVNTITLDLSANPIVYDGTSDLRIYLEATQGGWASLAFDYDGDYQNMKWSNSTSMKYNPLLYVTLAAEPLILSGTVKDNEGDAVAGATVTLVSDDGDNVQYTATTDATGAYSLDVIQSGRTYVATVTAENYEEATDTIAFAGENLTKNFVIKSKTPTGIAVAKTADKAGQVYSLQGRKVTGALKKGIYIIDGKKTVVR